MALNSTPYYVKFVRGTKAAYQNLVKNNAVSSDTLYFVYDNTSSQTGVLYLGTKLIGGSDEESVTELSKLLDVELSGHTAGSILVYNGVKWVNSTLQEALLTDKSLTIDELTGQLGISGFKTATVGQVPQVNADGAISWASVSNLTEIQTINQNLNLKANAADVFTKTETTEEIAKAITNAAHLSRKIVPSKDAINPGAADAEQYIYLVYREDAVNDNSYDEYMVLDGKVEKVGDWKVDLSDYSTTQEIADTYVTKTEFNTKVGSIEGNISTLTGKVETNTENIQALFEYDAKVGNLDNLIFNDVSYTTLVDQVNDLTNRLTWEEI